MSDRLAYLPSWPAAGETAFFTPRPFWADATTPNEHIGSWPVRGDSANGVKYELNVAPWAFQKSAGGNIWRFEVRGNDVSFSDVAASHNSSRCELTLQDNSTPASKANKFPLFTDLWGSCSFMIPLGCNIAPLIPTSTCVLFQNFATSDEGEPGRTPPFAFRLRPGPNNFRIMKRFDTNAITSGTLEEYVLYEAPLSLGVFHSVVWRTNFDWNQGGSGGVDVWLDGAQIVGFLGQIGYNDVNGPIAKIGLYKSPKNPADPPIIRYVANFEYGTSDLTARIASPLAIIS